MDSRLDLNTDSRMLQEGSGEGPQKPRACWGNTSRPGNASAKKSGHNSALALGEACRQWLFSFSRAVQGEDLGGHRLGTSRPHRVCQSLESFPSSKIIGVKPVGAIFSQTHHRDHRKMQRWLPPLEMAKTKALYINSWLKIHDGRSTSSRLEPGLQLKTSRG